jgi:hypothetical protein
MAKPPGGVNGQKVFLGFAALFAFRALTHLKARAITVPFILTVDEAEQFRKP